MIWEILLNSMRMICECIKMGIIFCFLLQGAYTNKKRNYFISGISIILICCFEQLFRNNGEIYILVSIIPVLICIFVSKGKLKNRIFRVICSYCLVNIIDNIAAICISYLTQISISDNEIYTRTFNCSILILYIALAVFIKRFYSPDNSNMEEISPRYIIISILDLICCFFVVGGLQGIMLGYVNLKLKLMISISMMTICLILVIQSFIENFLYNSRNYYREMLETKEKYIDVKNKYYDAQAKKQEEMREFRHDVKKHLRYIYQLNQSGEQEKIAEYISNIDASLYQSIDYIDCGNIMVSAIVTDISNQAKDNNIKFTCKGHLDEELGLELTDISTMLGNVLENAIEACIRCKKERFINIEFLQNKNSSIIIVTNTTNVKCIKENTKLPSSKTGRNHGIGMKNIVKIVEKNNGSINWHAENNVFTTEIII